MGAKGESLFIQPGPGGGPTPKGQTHRGVLGLTAIKTYMCPIKHVIKPNASLTRQGKERTMLNCQQFGCQDQYGLIMPTTFLYLVSLYPLQWWASQ